MSSYYDRILQESTLFELFESEAYSDTEKSLRIALVSINDQLMKVDGKTWTAKRLKDVQSSVNDEITKAYGGLFSTLNDETKDIGKLVASNMNTKVPISTINEINTPKRLVQGYEAKNLFKVTQDNHARQLNVLIGSGVSQGKSVASMVRDIATKNSKLTKGQLKNAVFTSVTEARAAARHESFKKLEKSGVIDGYEYVAVLDSRTTEYCRDHDNLKYWKSIEDIQNKINVHWHCRSVFVPITKSTNVESRASQFGPVPNESYGEWFSKQSPDFQKATLGKKYDSYKGGSYSVGGISDIAATGVALSLAEISTLINQPTETDII